MENMRKTKTDEKVRFHKSKNWEFMVEKGPIIDTNIYRNNLKKHSIFNQPEMIFDTKLHIKNKEEGFKLSLEPLNSIPYCFKDVLRKNKLLKPVKVKASTQWSKNKSETFINYEGKEEKFQNRDEKIDWSFTCAYSGDMQGAKNIEEKTEEKIDYAHLMDRSIDIDFSGEIDLYEDELGDFGISRLLAKLRVNGRSWFLLLRNLVFVNDVIVRVIDNRYFGWLDKNYFIREYSHKEMEAREYNKKFNLEYVTFPVIMSNAGQMTTLETFNQKIFI